MKRLDEIGDGDADEDWTAQLCKLVGSTGKQFILKFISVPCVVYIVYSWSELVISWNWNRWLCKSRKTGYRPCHGFVQNHIIRSIAATNEKKHKNFKMEAVKVYQRTSQRQYRRTHRFQNLWNHLEAFSFCIYITYILVDGSIFMIHTDGLFTDLSCKNAAASSLSISEIVVDVHASDVPEKPTTTGACAALSKTNLSLIGTCASFLFYFNSCNIAFLSTYWMIFRFSL